MYKKYLTVISLLILTAVTPAHAGSWNGWIYQNPYPTSNTLLAVKFITPKKGWIAGVQGTILYTEDGGDTWEAQESGTEQDIKSLSFINDKTGWAVGNRGAIIHTEDGGKKWSTQTNAKSALNSVIFINEKEGWAAGDQGTVLHTTDGGKKWTKKDIGAKRSIGSIHFIKPQVGWLLAGDEVYRTKDGGKSWEKTVLDIKMPRPGAPGKETMSFINVIGEAIPPDWWKGEIHFTDEKHGWAVVGLWYIFHTEDGGKTWKDQLNLGHISYGLSHITFADNNKGCATGSSILCTEDGGKTWKERLGIAPGESERINDFLIDLWGISFVNKSTGWAVGNDGQMMKTEDGGNTWTMEARQDKCGSTPFFINKNTGWLYSPRGESICRTDDGGTTWTKQAVGINIIEIFFVNDAIGWAVGRQQEGKDPNKPDKIYGVIRSTMDGGKTWVTQFEEAMGKSRADNGLVDVYFMNRDIGWVVGKKGKKGIVLHTNDGGKHWDGHPIGSELYFGRVCFIDAQNGWIAGFRVSEEVRKGIIFYTDDGGKNWQVQHRIEGVDLYGIFLIDNKFGWAIGNTEYGEQVWLLHTKDAGKTWSEQMIGNVPVGFPAFLNKDRGALTPQKGIMFITNDGGKTWNKRMAPLSKYPWHFSEIFEKGKP